MEKKINLNMYEALLGYYIDSLNKQIHKFGSMCLSIESSNHQDYFSICKTIRNSVNDLEVEFENQAKFRNTEQKKLEYEKSFDLKIYEAKKIIFDTYRENLEKLFKWVQEILNSIHEFIPKTENFNCSLQYFEVN